MLNVLVIDDEQSLLKLFNKILKNAGFRVETAINGYEGLEKFYAKHFDIVITDILMPGIQGNDVVNHIRNSQRPSTAIIGISGTPWKLSKHDFDSILPKPFSPETLLSTIENVCHHQVPMPITG